MNRYVRHFMSFGALALMVLFSSFSPVEQKTPSKNQALKNVPTPHNEHLQSLESLYGKSHLNKAESLAKQ